MQHDFVGPRGRGMIRTGEFSPDDAKNVRVGQHRSDSFCDTEATNVRENPPEGQFYEVVGQKPVPLQERIDRMRVGSILGTFKPVRNKKRRSRKALQLLSQE